MDKNSWKMRCIYAGKDIEYFTVGKIYEVINNCFKDDTGCAIGGVHSMFHGFDSWVHSCKHHWGKGINSKWELVEDEMTIQEKIAKAEAKIAKWQSKLDTLKQQEQEQEEKPLTGWENVKEYEKYYWMQSTGNLVVESDNGTWKKQREKLLNTFSTEEKALEIANEQLAYRMARKFADEWDERRDKGRLWCVFYDKEDKLLRYDSTCSFPSTAFLFPSEDCVSEFINQHGKEYAKLLRWELN